MPIKFHNALFYVMSGTGNSFRAACWMKETIEQMGGSADVVMIENADPVHEVDPSPDSLLGLVYPTHGLMAPWSMIKFLFRIPRRRGVPALCAVTRGAFRIGPLFIPGGSGIAGFMAALILLIKG